MNEPGPAVATQPVDAGRIAHPDLASPAPGAARRTRLRRASRILAAILMLFIVIVGWLAFTAPLSKSLEPIAPPQITLLASNGTPIARNGAIVDSPVKVAALPEHVIEAFLAIEDRRFYSHWGIDPRGLARAAWSNLTTGRTEGGSTITQQLAKFTFLSPERSLTRKGREALIALWLEAWLTKDEILERYLSNAYFGDNTYGLRAASLHYFHRQPERLTRAQAAMLAGLLKAPSRLAPTRDYAAAEKRMRVVLSAMVAAGHLDGRDAAQTAAPALDVRGVSALPTGTYFADWAMPQIREESDIGYARQTVKTTLDARLQGLARQAIGRAGLGKAQVALVAMRPNGEVVAMVGGRDYAVSPFNRATQARRQPGSTFKLFVYLAALEAGWTPTSRITNTPITAGGYRPGNYGDRYSPSLTLQDAFAQSSNVAAVRLFAEVGDKAVIRVARDLGITAALPRGDPSLALGTSGTTLLELTAAYAGFWANAWPLVPRAMPVREQGWIERLIDRKGSFSESVHADMAGMLTRAVSHGTGRAAALSGRSAGKTGTTQDSRDALFIGRAGDLVVGIWVGNDDSTPLPGITGGGAPARIWRDFVRSAQGKLAPARTRREPRGAVRPLDLPAIPELPVADDTALRIENGKAIVSTRVNGETVDLKVDLGSGEASSDWIGQQIERGRQLGAEEYRRMREDTRPEPAP